VMNLNPMEIAYVPSPANSARAEKTRLLVDGQPYSAKPDPPDGPKEPASGSESEQTVLRE